MEQTVAIHPSSQFMAFHEFEPDQVRALYLESMETELEEIRLPNGSKFHLATLRTRFVDGQSLSEIQFFSKHL